MNVEKPSVTWERRGAEEIWDTWQSLRADRDAPDIQATAVGLVVWASQYAPSAVPPLLRIAVGDRVLAYLPATVERSPARRLWTRVLRSPGNHYWSCGYPIVGADVGDGFRSLLGGLRRVRTWDVLEIGPMLAQGAGVQQLLDAGASLGMSPAVTRRTSDHGVAITGSWSAYYATRSTKLRQQISAGERALARLGPVSVEEWTGGDDLPDRLAEFFHLEASGWKGREKTAILSDPKTHAFYRDLAMALSARGWFRLFLLRVGEQCVAGEYGVDFNGTIALLKSGYDESLSKGSPGHVLRARVIQRLLDSEWCGNYTLGTIDAGHMSYKERWSNTSREYVRLRLFNPSTVRGRVAAAAQDVRRRLQPSTPVHQEVAVDACR